MQCRRRPVAGRHGNCRHQRGLTAGGHAATPPSCRCLPDDRPNQVMLLQVGPQITRSPFPACMSEVILTLACKQQAIVAVHVHNKGARVVRPAHLNAADAPADQERNGATVAALLRLVRMLATPGDRSKTGQAVGGICGATTFSRHRQTEYCLVQCIVEVKTMQATYLPCTCCPRISVVTSGGRTQTSAGDSQPAIWSIHLRQLHIKG